MNTESPPILWLDNLMLRRRSWLYFGLLLFAGVLAGGLFSLPSTDAQTEHLLALRIIILSSLLLFIAVLAWLIERLSQQRIGIQDGHIWLVQQAQRQVVVPLTQLTHGPQHLFADTLSVALGNAVWPFFAPQQIAQHLGPYLDRTPALSPPTVYSRLWQCRHPQILAGLALCTITLGMMLATRLLI